MDNNFRDTASSLVEMGRSFYARGWMLGTAGNFSAVLSRDPLRLAITPSGADKGEIRAEQILEIAWPNLSGHDLLRKPSAETLLHVEVVLARDAGAVLHTHSVWSTIVSDQYSAAGGIMLEGFEMLKGLEGVKSHEHREWLPIMENSQDMPALAAKVSRVLREHSAAHAFLIRRHGLYTWGANLAQAKRHVEILEFLLETAGRLALRPPHV